LYHSGALPRSRRDRDKRVSLTDARNYPIIVQPRRASVARTQFVDTVHQRMSEPLRTDPSDPGPLSEADRAARIEELLLSGLDQYFGGHYEQAIHIWTRVAFLERGHGRARAYIERARDALAEKQRESEELLHTGVAAYQAGDLDKARDLLTRAVDEGGPNETALAFLQRVSRARIASEPTRAEGTATRRRRGEVRTTRSERPRTGWVLSMVVAAIVSAVIVFGALAVRSWIVELPVAGPSAGTTIGDPLPVIRGSEIRLARARDLYAQGLPHDALRVLSEVDVGDPLRGEADRLTADLQRRLLGIAPQEPAATAAGETAR
jgi:tetratricopeptide (TPR) repeat protein